MRITCCLMELWESCTLAFPCSVNGIFHDGTASYTHFHGAYPKYHSCAMFISIRGGFHLPRVNTSKQSPAKTRREKPVLRGKRIIYIERNASSLFSQKPHGIFPHKRRTRSRSRHAGIYTPDDLSARFADADNRSRLEFFCSPVPPQYNGLLFRSCSDSGWALRCCPSFARQGRNLYPLLLPYIHRQSPPELSILIQLHIKARWLIPKGEHHLFVSVQRPCGNPFSPDNTADRKSVV